MYEYPGKKTFFTGLIDTHAHLSMLKEDEVSREARVRELFDAGFGCIVDIGTEADDLSLRMADFAGFEGVRFAAGVWPYPQAITDPEGRLSTLEAQMAGAPRDSLAALGECGLDRHHNRPSAGADLAGERRLFEGHLHLAEKLNLPIIIHSREAFEETKAILASHSGPRGVIHSFSYGLPEARDFLNLGYYLSFTGVLTYKNAFNLREALIFAPRDRILLETDSPFLAPRPFRGKPAHPGMVLETYRCAAELLGLDLEDLKSRIAENCLNLFGFSSNFLS
ncbi:MAG: TatD family hydrolase [Spirochaetaceae bacterium]|nr:TatD family hydrolase [Spirochaetaceae bacterium]